MSVEHSFYTGKGVRKFIFQNESSIWNILKGDYPRIVMAIFKRGNDVEKLLGIVLKAKSVAPDSSDDVFLFRQSDLNSYFTIPRVVYWVSEFPLYSWGSGPGHFKALEQKHKIIMTYNSFTEREDQLQSKLESCIADGIFVNRIYEGYPGRVINLSKDKFPADSGSSFIMVAVDFEKLTVNAVGLDNIVTLYVRSQHALLYVPTHVKYSDATIFQLQHHVQLLNAKNVKTDEQLMNILSTGDDMAQKLFRSAIRGTIAALRSHKHWNDCVQTYFATVYSMQLNFDCQEDFSEATRRRVINVVMDAASSYTGYQVKAEETLFRDRRELNAGHGPLDYLIPSHSQPTRLFLDEKRIFNVAQFQIPELPQPVFGNGGTLKRRIDDDAKELGITSASSSSSAPSAQSASSQPYFPAIFTVNPSLERAMVADEDWAMEEEDTYAWHPDVERMAEDVGGHMSVTEAKVNAMHGISQACLQGRDCLVTEDSISNGIRYCFCCLTSGQTYHFMGVNWTDPTANPFLEYFGTLKMPYFVYAKKTDRKSGCLQSKDDPRLYERVNYIDFEFVVAAVVLMMKGSLKERVSEEYAMQKQTPSNFKD